MSDMQGATNKQSLPGFAVLSGNMLKLIAALSMLIDHIGVILLPQLRVLRILGRLAFPIFSFMITEGCRYTRNRWRYFATVLATGLVCQAGLWIYDPGAKLNVLLTFSLSILLVYALQYFKQALQRDISPLRQYLCIFPLLLALVLMLLLAHFVRIEYGAGGCLLALFPAILHPVERGARGYAEDQLAPLLLFSMGLVLHCLMLGGLQWWSLFSLPLLFLYSGKRGKWKGKAFFYLFYPLHILILEGLALLLG